VLDPAYGVACKVQCTGNSGFLALQVLFGLLSPLRRNHPDTAAVVQLTLVAGADGVDTFAVLRVG
jgi:hypothetical protein